MNYRSADIRKFRNDGGTGLSEIIRTRRLVHQCSDQQIEKNSGEPKVDRYIQKKQLAPFRIATHAEGQEDEKRQCGE